MPTVTFIQPDGTREDVEAEDRFRWNCWSRLGGCYRFRRGRRRGSG